MGFLDCLYKSIYFQKVKGNVVQNIFKVQEGATVHFGGQNPSEVARSSSRSEETFDTGNEVSFYLIVFISTEYITVPFCCKYVLSQLHQCLGFYF